MVSLNDLAARLNNIYDAAINLWKKLAVAAASRQLCFEIDMDRAWRILAYLSQRQLLILFFLFIFIH